MTAEQVVREVAAAVGLAEGEAGVRDAIAVVRRLGVAPTRAISRATGLPVPIVAAISGELRKRGVVGRERPTRLTPHGLRLFGGAGLPIPPDRLLEELAALAEAAPPVRTELDQSHCTPATKVRRALALHAAGALHGRRVLLLGDDDLISLAIERLGAARELVVVDVDPAVLAYIRRTAPSVHTVEHDLRLPLPAELAARFDTVVTDPPYTVAGAELFLSRAAAALAPGGGGTVFFAFGSKPPEESLRVQEAILRMSFVVRSLERNFNEYRGAGLLGGTSHLYHLTSTAGTRPLVAVRHRGPLYTGDTRPLRRYRCASCGTVQRVGRDGRWTTVVQLKDDRCPECGGAKFRPLPPGERPQTRW